MADSNEAGTLCYLDAGRVQSPAGHLAGVDLRGVADEKLGEIAGVLIDPRARRLRYLVVDTPGWFRRHRYLLPLDTPARVDPESGTMRVPLTPADLTRCPKFDARQIHEFGDEEMLAALFTDRAA